MKLVSGGRVEKFAGGRVCEAPDCLTVLSRYNPSTLCGRHQGWDQSAGNGRQRRPRRRSDAQDSPGAGSDELSLDDPDEPAAQDWITWVMTAPGSDRP